MTEYLSMDHSKNRGPQVAGVAWTFCIMSSISILLRCYCRVFVVKSFGLDDWTAVIAQVLFLAFCGCCITGVHYGTGQHTTDIIPENLPIALKYWWCCEPLYILVNMFIKLSIAVFLLRLSVVTTQKIIIWITLIISEVYGLFFFILFILQCRPTSYFWERFSPTPPGHGTCISVTITAGVFFGYSAVCCLTDWTLSILPGFMVWNLQMNTRTKLSVAMILAVGAIASTATIIRIPYLNGITDSADFLYSTTDIAIWSTVETGIGITASSLATLRPLLRTFLGRSKVFGGSSSNHTGTKGFPGSHTGYQRSSTKHTINDDFGVVTVINVRARESETELNNLEGGTESSRAAGWSNDTSALADDSSEEFDGQESWKVEVSKTVIQTHDTV